MIFRIPASSVAPALPSVAPNEPDPTFGVLLGEVRRTPQADEIELIRSHVARGEPVLWRIEASPRAFPTLFAEAEAEVAAAVHSLAPPRVPHGRRLSPWLFVAVLAGAAFSALVAAKTRLYGQACAAVASSPRALVALPTVVRALVAGLSLGVAIHSGAVLGEPLVAAIALVMAMLASALGIPRRERRPRGPGRWLPISEAEAFVAPVRVLPGAWLDSGTLRGFAALALSFALFVGGALFELGRSPYHALFVLLSSVVLLPVFFTGRASDLVADRVAFSRRFVRELYSKLGRRPGLRAVPWARVPDDAGEPDELRLLVQPRDAASGLVALETGVEPERGIAGFLASPFVIVRAREGSDAQRLLPRELVWTRGRRADERVAILKPKLPTVALTLALVERLTVLFSNQRPKSSRMSSGISASTAKSARVPSPAHAT